MKFQVPRWLMHPEVWRFFGCASTIAGLLCYARSTSFNHLFGNWNLIKFFLYIVFSFITCLATLFAKLWKYSASLRFRAHMAFLVLTITSVYSFFWDKAVSIKPDAYSLISCAAFAVASLSLSMQIRCGFEVDLLYFFLGVLIVQLMKIALLLGMVGVGFSYSLIILRSSLDGVSASPENQDQNHLVIEVDSPQQSDVAEQFMARIGAVSKKNRDINKILEEYREASYQQLELVTDHNLVIDALPPGMTAGLQIAAEDAVAAGFEKECSDVYVSCRREYTEEQLSRLFELPDGKTRLGVWPKTMTPLLVPRWIRASTFALKILFPFERRLCDRVFYGLSPSIADHCFTETCREVTVRLLDLADDAAAAAAAKESRGLARMLEGLDVFVTLRGLIPDLQSLFSDGLLVNEAVAVHNKLRDSIMSTYTDMKDLIFQNELPYEFRHHANGQVHPTTTYAVHYIRSSCQSRKKLEPILQECLPNLGTSASFSVQMVSLMELLERKLKAESKNFEDVALRYFFMMNNRRYIDKIVKAWNLGTHLSDDWVQNNSAKVQKNLESYRTSSWGNLLDFLKLDNNDQSQIAPDVAAESMKKKLDLFNTHFDKICTDQSRWLVNDLKLRGEIRTSLERMLLPAYGNFIERFHNVLASHAHEYIKYGMLDIEARLKDLFL